MAHEYLVYGLRIVSSIALPGFSAVGHDAGLDPVHVTFGELPAQAVETTDEEAWPHRQLVAGSDPEDPQVSTWDEGRWFRFRYSDGVECVFDAGGREVWLRSIEDPVPDLASLYLAGPILGFILRQRGLTALHASAVCIGAAALVFTGPSGMGKSTLAYALASRGHAVVAEDVVVLSLSGEEVLALPGHARLRVWGDAVAGIEGEQAQRPLLHPDWEKAFVALGEGGWSQVEQPVRVAEIVLLERSDDASSSAPALVSLAPAEALPRLAANTYRNDLISPASRVEEFDTLARLLGRVPTSTLRYVSGFERVGELCELLERRFAATDAGA